MRFKMKQSSDKQPIRFDQRNVFYQKLAITFEFKSRSVKLTPNP